MAIKTIVCKYKIVIEFWIKINVKKNLIIIQKITNPGGYNKFQIITMIINGVICNNVDSKFIPLFVGVTDSIKLKYEAIRVGSRFDCVNSLHELPIEFVVLIALIVLQLVELNNYFQPFDFGQILAEMLYKN